MSDNDSPTMHPLIGAGLHYKGEDGCVENQGEIIAVIPSNNAAVGDLALIQYYEWVIGTASTRRLVSLADLANSDRWVFYRSVKEMNDHYGSTTIKSIRAARQG
jgi:hypothetical protein